MALVVLLRGVNVGGHRTFRPAELARQLAALDVVNIGAAGTFVVRSPVTQTRLRAELTRRLPFDTAIMICPGREVLSLVAQGHFPAVPKRAETIPFVSTLARRPRSGPATPLSIPQQGRWLVRVIVREGRFLVGVHRREMRAIGRLGELDRLFGIPATTRNWSTFEKIAQVLERPAG